VLRLMVQNRETLEDGALTAYGPDIQAISAALPFMSTKFSKARSPLTYRLRYQRNFS
jgi:hypothetical protein